jgi:predicted ABC-type ATPase
MPVLGTHVNADDLKRECNLTDLEAARQAEALRNELLSKKADFSFETVLLLPQLISVCDKILVYDNSDTPKLIYHKEKAFTQYYPNALWPEDKLRTLLGL